MAGGGEALGGWFLPGYRGGGCWEVWLRPGRGERVLEATLRNCRVRPHPAPAPATSLARVLHTELQLASCDHGAAEPASHTRTGRGHFLRLAQMII